MNSNKAQNLEFQSDSEFALPTKVSHPASFEETSLPFLDYSVITSAGAVSLQGDTHPPQNSFW